MGRINVVLSLSIDLENAAKGWAVDDGQRAHPKAFYDLYISREICTCMSDL